MSFVAKFTGPPLTGKTGDKPFVTVISGATHDHIGERVGIDFNPGKHEPTAAMKAWFLALMRHVENQKVIANGHSARTGTTPTAAATKRHAQRQAYFDQALDHLNIAQMLAVKALHHVKVDDYA